MKTAVYIDVLFAINFIINFLLLLATAKISRLQFSYARVVLGSFIGAVYSVFMFFPQIKVLYTIAAKIAVSFILVAATFTIHKVRTFFKVVLIFYITSFLFGAVCLAGFFFTGGGGGTVISNGIFYFNLPLRILIFSSFASYGVIRILWRIYRADKFRTYKKVEISLEGKTVCLNGLIDTGNMLKEPVTHTPVVVAQFEPLQPILPDSFKEAYATMHSTPENLILNSEGGEMASRLRIIPFSSLGNSRGMMLGFKPDFVTIDKRISENIIIGISPDILSAGANYEALINPEIFTVI